MVAMMTDRQERIERARSALLAAVAGGAIDYIGGGDFLVHVPGIDAEIDTAMQLFCGCEGQAV